MALGQYLVLEPWQFEGHRRLMTHCRRNAGVVVAFYKSQSRLRITFFKMRAREPGPDEVVRVENQNMDRSVELTFLLKMCPFY